MKTLFALVIVGLASVGMYYVQSKPLAIKEATEDTRAYFVDAITEKGKEVEGYAKLGLGGEVDGFTLRNAYTKLLPSDFEGVQAYQGEYFEENGTLLYGGNAASNSAVILEPGMQTLLTNLALRFQISPHTKEGIDAILNELGK